jgi:RNA polymerase sigma-70 factor (ECF subfamily)
VNHALLAAERPALVAHARRLGLQHADAEDLAQDTLVRAVRFEHRFDGRNLRGWLLRILTNQFMSDRRRKVPQPVEELPDSGGTVDGVDTLLDRLELTDALAAIPPARAEAIVLHHVAGWRNLDVAAHQGVAVGTVAGRIHRGLAQLREQMEAAA